MRVSKEVMADHRTQILDAAAQLFRARGFEGVSVAELMKQAGLTHGGFYGHFSSKEDLIARALERLLLQSTKKWENVMEQADGDPIVAFAKSYLGMAHRSGEGCLFPTLGADLARLPADTRVNFAKPLSSFFESIAKFFRGKSHKDRRQASIVAFASLIGAVVLAQAVEDKSFSNEMLEAVSASLAKQQRLSTG